MISEALESPAFYILSGLGISAVLLGYKMSKKMDIATLPIWQLVIILLVIVLASAFYAGRD